MSQKSDILAYLKKGQPITPMIALNDLGCFRLAARILELREEGHAIHCENLPVGNNRRIGYYTLLSTGDVK